MNNRVKSQNNVQALLEAELTKITLLMFDLLLHSALKTSYFSIWCQCALRIFFL